MCRCRCRVLPTSVFDDLGSMMARGAYTSVGQWQPYMTNHQVYNFCEKKTKAAQVVLFLHLFCVLCFFWHHFCIYENLYPSAIFAVRS